MLQNINPDFLFADNYIDVLYIYLVIGLIGGYFNNCYEVRTNACLLWSTFITRFYRSVSTALPVSNCKRIYLLSLIALNRILGRINEVARLHGI